MIITFIFEQKIRQNPFLPVKYFSQIDTFITNTFYVNELVVIVVPKPRLEKRRPRSNFVESNMI